MRYNHWHVGDGMPGYLSDSISTLKTKRDASRYAKESADNYRESNWDVKKEDRYTIRGNMKEGYWITFGISGFRQIDIWPCNEKECEEAEDYM